MKRIQSACLEQTIRFLTKDDVPVEESRRLVQAEYRHYLEQLDRNRTGYKVLEETPQPDGSLLVLLKRQYNHYSTGDFLK